MTPPSELYDDVEFLTQGGMARVYRARRRETNRVVAVREVPGGVDGEQRMESERHGAEVQRALGAIDRRVPTVYDVTTGPNGWLYVEMELVDGEDLADRLQRGPLPVEEAVRIAREIFDFLRIAHNQAVVVNGERRDHQLHGDLTPRNVRIGSDGTVRILDFGIAKGLKATVTAQAFANYGYISPDRARTGRMGLADDYWSAGVLLYEMLSGTRAFPGSPEEIRASLALRKPPLPLDSSVPRPLRLIVAKLLAWDPAFRYPTADAVLADLTRFIEKKKTQAEMEEEAGRTRPAGPAGPTPRTAPLPPAPPSPRGAGPAAAPAVAPAAPPPAAPMPAPAATVAMTTARPRPWKRAAALFLFLIIFVHERAVWRDADTYARVAATEEVPPDRLWAQLESVRNRAWLSMTTSEFGRRVAERLRELAVATLADYREDVPTVRRPQLEAARALLARAARIDLKDSLTAGWLRYAEGHLARMDAESKPEEERRPSLRQAIARFEQAAALAPQLPDPHIALAHIYTYDIPDPDRARRAISAAEQLGHPPGLRGHAQLGDLFKAEGEALLRQARGLYGMNSEEPALARAQVELEAAADEYDKARGFGESVRSLRQVNTIMRSIEGRLEYLHAESAPPAQNPNAAEADQQAAAAEPEDAAQW